MNNHFCADNASLCPTQTLIDSVIARLRSCVDEDVFIPLYPKKSVSFLNKKPFLTNNTKLNNEASVTSHQSFMHSTV